MEKSILLHCIAVEDFKEMIMEVIRTGFAEQQIPVTGTDPEILLTRQETAALLRISLTSLWQWTNKGKLRSYGLGNRRYYKKSEVMESLTAF